MSDKKWKNWSELENVKGTNTRGVDDMMEDFSFMLSYFQSYPD